MSWFLLILAGAFECCWTVGMKFSRGLTLLGPTVWTFAALIASFCLLAVATKNLPLGVAYSVWTGIGIVGSVLCDAIFFGAPFSLPKTLYVAAILAGIVGLKLCE